MSWSDGVMEKWSDGVVECWGVGVLGWWSYRPIKKFRLGNARNFSFIG